MYNLSKNKSKILVALIVVLCASLLGGCAVSDYLYKRIETEISSIDTPHS